jgi:hypothetical protein
MSQTYQEVLVRKPHPRIFETSLKVDTALADRLESDGFLYKGTTEHEVCGTTIAIDRYTVIGGETSVFHLQLKDKSYVVVMDLQIEGDVDLAISFLAMGVCLGIPVDTSIKVAEDIDMIA